MTAFYQESISGFSNFSDVLVERLANGKPLSLFVDGIVSVLRANGELLIKEQSLTSSQIVNY